jgi:hypothetical protein
VLHTDFAERAARRLEAVADRLEKEGRWLKLDTVSARAKELRVAAYLVRNEAAAVTQEENSRGRARRSKNSTLREMEVSRHESSHREDQDVVA